MIEGRMMCDGSSYVVVDAAGDVLVDLYCGYVLDVFQYGEWVSTRLEVDAADQWYLVGTPYSGMLDNVRVRL